MKVVLAFSGGLDTTACLVWFKRRGFEVIAFCADVGQEEDFDEIRRRAKECGADDFVLEDIKEEFVKDFVFPMLRADAVYETGYLLGTSIARPAIAKKQVEVARRFKAKGLAHGATWKGNDQIRFELTYKFLAPELEIIAPWRIWEFKGREDLIKFLEKEGIDVPTSPERPYSIDSNALHTSYEGGILEDPWSEPPKDMFSKTRAPELAPDTPEYLEIEFKEGDPVAVNGERTSPFEILKMLNRKVGEHGIGRADIVETRSNGLKSRGVYETPGGTVIYIARRALEGLCLDGEVLKLKDSLVPYYASLVYKGFWFSPERSALQNFIDSTQKNVEGIVRLKLYKGNVYVVGRKSERSLYRKDIISFETEEGIKPEWADGFISTLGLRFIIGR